jgi:ATP-dependent protease ClpP protease subunit
MDKETKQVIKNAGGEIIKVIKMHGEVLDEVTLADLKGQTGKVSNFDTLVVEIASPGGSVSEGLDIMVWLDKLSQEGKQIVTVVTANSYSIASLIMLVADIKLISTHGKVMVHNPMVPLLEYVNANDLQQYIDNLRQLENTMYELYEFFTGLKQEQIKMLMDKESYLTPQEAVDLGFADMVVDIKPKSYEMTANNKKPINMSKTLNILNKVIGMVNKSEFINQIYSDLEGGEVEIFQSDAATYQVGDRTSMEEGEVVLSDGSKLTIVEGKISEISRSAEGEVAPEAAEFNEGEAPKEILTEEMVEEEAPAMEQADEIMAEDEVIEEAAPAVEEVVEAAPKSIIETKKETVSTKEIINEEVEMKEEEMVAEEVEMKEEEMIEEEMAQDGSEEALEVTEDHMADMHATIEALESRIAQLEDMILGYDSKFEALSKFENIATEAIDTLASNTVSNFKPEARVATTPVKSKGSIFSQLKTKRGL